MNVTFCGLDWPNYVGGPNAWLRRVVPQLIDRGVRVRVLFLTDRGAPDRCPSVMALRSQGVDCAAVPRQTYINDQVRWILRRLREDPPDVFVADCFAAYYAGYWMRAARIPTVGVVRSDDPVYRCLQDQFVFGDKDYRLSAVVCVSKFLEQQLLGRHPQGVLIRRIPSGAPIPSARAQPPVGCMRLVYTGRLVEEQKRISELTRALCRAVAEVPNIEAVINGEGPAISAVKQVLASHGKGLPVYLSGRIDSARIQEILLKSHVFVLLSDYEGLSTSLMEAMASGVVPVCLRMRSGVPELIEHDKTGLLVNDRGDDFVDAVRRLRSEPEMWERLSIAAREKIQAGYSIQASAASWESLLRELAETAQTTRTLRVPWRVVLPPVPSVFASGSMRKSPLPMLVLRGGWRFAGRLVRRVLN